MAEYIEREAAQTECRKYSFAESYDAFAVDCILKAIPAADVAHVVHGRWELTEFWKYENKHSILYKTNRCSLCHYDVSSRLSYKYCPNCGAKMDGDKDGH